MSLNKTLDRLFDEIRREAKRNPDFADRMDAVMRAHASRRDVPDEAQAEVTETAAPPVAAAAPSAPEAPTAPPARKKGKAAPNINPAGLYKREGAEALVAALTGQDLGSLRALVSEHNLDPSGVTATLTRAELADHILAQAKRRAERDEKMFDY